eukprot:scaffold28911_cov62-Phaeocystis_antarctica.AAC.4
MAATRVRRAVGSRRRRRWAREAAGPAASVRRAPRCAAPRRGAAMPERAARPRSPPPSPRGRRRRCTHRREGWPAASAPGRRPVAPSAPPHARSDRSGLQDCGRPRRSGGSRSGAVASASGCQPAAAAAAAAGSSPCRPREA